MLLMCFRTFHLTGKNRLRLHNFLIQFNFGFFYRLNGVLNLKMNLMRFLGCFIGVFKSKKILKNKFLESKKKKI